MLTTEKKNINLQNKNNNNNIIIIKTTIPCLYNYTLFNIHY